MENLIPKRILAIEEIVERKETIKPKAVPAMQHKEAV